MAASIVLDRTSAGGKYEPIIDVCERQKKTNGSAVNALAELVYESDTYKRIRAVLDAEIAEKTAAAIGATEKSASTKRSRR